MKEQGLWGEALSVDEPGGRRWEVALQLLAEGGFVEWKGIGLAFQSQVGPGPSRIGNTLFVRLAIGPGHITREEAKAELLAAQDEVRRLSERAEDFARLIAGHPISYELGTESVVVATWDEDGFQDLYR